MGWGNGAGVGSGFLCLRVKVSGLQVWLRAWGSGFQGLRDSRPGVWGFRVSVPEVQGFRPGVEGFRASGPVV